MSETSPAEPRPFKNRRGGLIFFGIVQIGLGVLAALLAVAVVMSVFMVPTGAGTAQARLTLPGAFFYLFAAALLITLGIGSIRTRRWAWALTLVSSWIWLLTGVLTTIILVALMPMLFREIPSDQEGLKVVVIGCMAVFLGLFNLLPLTLVLFYRSRNVRATVEALDPVPRWTDRLPLSVLAFSVLTFFASVSMLIWGFVYPSLPVGPWMIRGVALIGLVLAMSIVFMFIAMGFARLWRSAWWTALAFFLLGGVYNAFFLFHVDWLAWYKEMGMPTDQQQIVLLKWMFSNPFFMGTILAAWVAYFAWLLYLRRFFYPRPATAA